MLYDFNDKYRNVFQYTYSGKNKTIKTVKRSVGCQGRGVVRGKNQ